MPDFPRGGKQELSALEYRDITEKAEKDLFAEEVLPSKKRKANPTEEVVKKPKSEFVAMLTWKRLLPGATIIGIVKEIHELEIVVSLPNQLQGYVSITEISPQVTDKVTAVANASSSDNEDESMEDEEELPSLEDYFQIGQPVVAKILSTGDGEKKKIELSLDPAQLNVGLESSHLTVGMTVSGTVTSIEDHGYVINSGIDGTNAFLPKKETEKSLKVGAVIFANVIQRNAKVITLSILSDRFLSSLISSSSSLEMDGLVAGCQVQGKISAITQGGLKLTVLGIFEASMESSHCHFQTDLEDHYKIGQKVKCRILWIDTATKSMGLTSAEHLLSWKSVLCSHTIGDIKTVTVKRVDDRVGLLVEWDENQLGYVHISKIKDDRIAKIDESYYPDTTHKARITGFDHCNNMLLLSLSPNVINEAFVRLDDIKPCAIVRGIVEKIESFGMLVAVTSAIKGLVPTIHLSDAQISKPEKMFKIGAKLKFRVISVDLEKKRLILTLKKSLIQAEESSLFSNYENISVGDTSVGVITSIKEYGCIISFFNDVRALAPISELTNERIESPSAVFHLGQTVKCRALSVNAADAKLRVSLKVSQIQNAQEAVVGSIHHAIFVSANSQGVIAKIVGSSNIVTIPVPHLADNLLYAEKLHKALANGKAQKDFSLGQVLIYDVDVTHGVISGTIKKILVDYYSSNPFNESVQSLTEGVVIPAIVKNMTDKLCFVQIGSVVAVANTHNVSDSFVSSVKDCLKVGQTVLANVLSIDKSTGRVFVSLKPSALQPALDVVKFECNFLHGIFLSEQQLLKAGKKSFEWADKFPIGQLVSGAVEQLMSYGATVKLSNKVSGLLADNNLKTNVGQEVQCQVLDVNFASKIVDLGKAEIKSNPDHAALSKAFQDSKKIEAVVEIVKEYYAIVRLPAFNSVGYILLRSINALSSPPRFKLGQKLYVQISAIIKEGATRVIVQQLKTDSTKAAAIANVMETRRLIRNPVDESLSSLDDIELGLTINVKIQSVKRNQLNIKIGDNVRGRIHISEVFDKIEDISDLKNPLGQFMAGQTIKCKVIGYHSLKSHKFLPISHSKPTSQIGIELTLRPSMMQKVNISDEMLTIDNLGATSKLLGFVTQVGNDCMWVQLSPSLLGRVDSVQVSSEISVISNLNSNFREGQAVSCSVVSIDQQKARVNLSLLDNERPLSTGDLVVGRIVQIDPQTGISLLIGPQLFGKVQLAELCNFKESPCDDFSLGQHVKALVLDVDEKIELSLKSTTLQEILTISGIQPGSVVNGYIRYISEKGCFVSLGYNLNARVKISELSDAYVKDWKSLFKQGQLVKGKILSVDMSRNQMEMSLKPSSIDPNLKLLSFADIKPLTIMDGLVKKIETFGMFIQLNGTNVRGLCHISEVADTPVKNIEKIYAVDDPVRVYILKVDVENRKASLSLKASYFECEDVSEDENSDEKSGSATRTTVFQVDSDIESESEGDDDLAGDSSDEETALKITDDSVDEECLDNDQDSENEAPIVNAPAGAPLTLEGFSWDATSTSKQIDDSSSSDEEEDEEPKLSKKEEKLAKERKISELEESLLDKNRVPEMPDDFERLLLESPNDSYLWIKYMAFQLELAEIDKARQVADRALDIINFREEQERLNILVAHLNLENKFGNEESLLKVFEKACRMNDPKKVHMQLVDIYSREKKDDLAEELHKKMVKRFNGSCKIWLGYALFLIHRDRSEDARLLLKRSLQSLPHHKHLKILIKFGQAEFKMGDPERGRTVFEGLIGKYSKKPDIWSVYLDMEIRNGDIGCCRRLFERSLRIKWSTKKMKFFFKKYLDFEKKKGTPEGVNHVKQAAMDYVQSSGK